MSLSGSCCLPGSEGKVRCGSEKEDATQWESGIGDQLRIPGPSGLAGDLFAPDSSRCPHSVRVKACRDLTRYWRNNRMGRKEADGVDGSALVVVFAVLEGGRRTGGARRCFGRKRAGQWQAKCRDGLLLLRTVEDEDARMRMQGWCVRKRREVRKATR